MNEISEELQLALEADDRDRLDMIIEKDDPDDFATLLSIVQDEEAPESYRRKSLYAVGEMTDPDGTAVTIIGEALPGMSELERITAVNVLGGIGTAEATEVVIKNATDDAPDVRREVVRSLDRIGTAEAMSSLSAMAAEEEVDYVQEMAEERLQDAEERNDDSQ